MSIIKKTAAFAVTGTLALLSGAALAQEPIKIGVLEDQSGEFVVPVIGKVHAIQLATEEINAKGGIAGRPIELVIYDTQSDNTRFQEFTRRALQRDKVDVILQVFPRLPARPIGRSCASLMALPL